METLKTQENTRKPQIYVACLAAYNGGFLHGKWITPEADKDKLLEQFDEVIKTKKDGVCIWKR